jgi:3-hydroxyacyl-[acyl-carrier-protein] dehydratase
MIFKDNFYSINSISETEGIIDASIFIDASHPIFSGHFPGNPVTPGVVQVEMLKELLSVHYQRPLRLKSMSNCKFQAILNPHVHPDIFVKIKLLPSEAGAIKISGNITSGSISFLQIQAIFN